MEKRLKQQPEAFCKKDVLKNFANFTGKHMCRSQYKVADLWLNLNFPKFLRKPIS